MIKLSKKAYDGLVAHAKSGYPNEACGILGGAAKGQASEFFAMKNLDESSISYFMDPKEQLQVFKKMREQKIEMTGIYHSHVASEAYPSQKDVRLAFYPEVSYLIVSLSDKVKPVLRSFQIRDEKVTEEEIQIV
ncbi:MAG TPA: M67 family metallopeptidase [Candidatus Omnitrophota bacterium]|nr:M67 family metallopeptidase [Candidatus Omnitrophota bacterium]